MTSDLRFSEIEEFSKASALYLREEAYKRGQDIFQFMKKNGIGENLIGKLMDAAAKGKGLMAHRLFGHHVIYNFPVSNLYTAPEFLEHLLSDFFTKQGLPILPGEILEKWKILKNLDKLGPNWNFLNGFDVLAGTLVIISGLSQIRKAQRGAFFEDDSDAFLTLVINTASVGFGFATKNILLIAGGVMNIGATLYMLQYDANERWLQRKLEMGSLDKILEDNSIDKILEGISLDAILEECKIKG